MTRSMREAEQSQIQLLQRSMGGSERGPSIVEEILCSILQIWELRGHPASVAGSRTLL